MISQNMSAVLAAALAWSLPADAGSEGLPGPPGPQVEDVTNALDLIDDARRRFVTEVSRGDTLGMAHEAEVREAALDALEWGVEHPALIRELSWPLRTRWIEITLQERRLEWSRVLLTELEGRVPDEGMPSRGPAALAIGVAARRLLAEDPEDERAFLGTPSRPLLEVARTAFRAAAAEEFVLRDEAFYRLWELAEGEGDTLEALVWADSLVATRPRSSRTPRVRATRARAMLAAGDPAPAVEELRLALDAGDEPGLRWLLIEAYLAMDFPREAGRELRHLIGAFGSDPLAPRAFALLESLGDGDPDLALSPLEIVRLVPSMFGNPDSDALNRVGALARADSVERGIRDEASLALARYHYRGRRYEAAVPILERLVREGGEDVLEEAELTLARIHRNTGRLQPMERRYRAVLDRAGPEAVRALWELAREHESQADWERAEAVYSQGLERFTRSARSHDMRFRRGFDRVRLGRLEAALEDFRAALRSARTESQTEQAAFWLARTLAALGREEAAAAAARAGIERPEPAGAYGVFLRRRWGAAAPPRSGPAAGDSAAQGLQLTPVLFVDTGEWPEPVRSHYTRGRALAALGELEAAREEWVRAYRLADRDLSVVQGLALAAAEHDVYPEGVRWATRARRLLPDPHPLTVAFDRLAYPPAYYGDVVREAARNRVDPFPLWALMRQESLYDPVAVSRAGALGLMQIMPYTLNRITTEAGMPPMSPDVLFRPRVNITLGTRFYSDRLQEFGGSLLPTLASYNAGEQKSLEWLERAGGDDQEVFLECIGYPETYDYVRRIIWLIWLYRAYYGGE